MTSTNIFAMPSSSHRRQTVEPNFPQDAKSLKNFGRARLLPSCLRQGSAGASPSLESNSLGKLVRNMFTAVASPPSFPKRFVVNAPMGLSHRT